MNMNSEELDSTNNSYPNSNNNDNSDSGVKNEELQNQYPENEQLLRKRFVSAILAVT